MGDPGAAAGARRLGNHSPATRQRHQALLLRETESPGRASHHRFVQDPGTSVSPYEQARRFQTAAFVVWRLYQMSHLLVDVADAVRSTPDNDKAGRRSAILSATVPTSPFAGASSVYRGTGKELDPSYRVFVNTLINRLNTVTTARLAAIDLPTLVVWGRKDGIVPLRLGRRLARALPNARLLVIDDCGHSPHQQCPDEVAAALKALVRDARSDRASA